MPAIKQPTIYEHHQGIPEHRFWSFIRAGDQITCSHCSDVYFVEGKPRLLGGPYLAARKHGRDPDVEAMYWCEKEGIFEGSTSYPFQCFDCGLITDVDVVHKGSYPLTTKQKCACGCLLTRNYPYFCSKCRWDQPVHFDVNRFLAGDKRRIEEWVAEDVPEIPADFYDNDLILGPYIEPPSIVLNVEGGPLPFYDPEHYRQLSRYDIQVYLMEISRPDEHHWRSRWCMFYSDENLLVLVDPDQPFTLMLEVHYENVPLNASLPGWFEIRLVTDDDKRLEIDSQIYSTPMENGLDWFYQSLDKIVEDEWWMG